MHDCSISVKGRIDPGINKPGVDTVGITPPACLSVYEN